MSWRNELQQASYRGLPFAVLGGESRFGRRVEAHEYPMRDKPYVEDLGRSIRRINVVGFLVENSLVYGGGSVIAQRLAMIGAAETAGPGTLVHPTLGELTVSIPEGGLVVTERWDAGRYFELGFSFIDSGERIFPSISDASDSQVMSFADALDAAAGSDFLSTLLESINLGLGIVQGVISLGNAIVGIVVSIAAAFSSLVSQSSRDATSLLNMASLLGGNNGRYVNASVTSAYVTAQQSSANSGLTMATLTAQGAEDRAAVTAACASLAAASLGLDSTTLATYPATVQAVTAALATAIVNPGDATRLFGALASYTPNLVIPGAGQTSAGQLVAQAAMGAIIRRAAIGAMARAVTTYQPSSYNDAVSVRSMVVEAIDAEMLVAGDAGDDASYGALRFLRQGVVALMSKSGANLAPLQSFSLKGSLPALALANRLYQDASRSDQLVQQVNPIHPAFMPTSFQALAS